MWPIFYFNGNQIFIEVHCPEDWQQVVNAYKGNLRLLLDARMIDDPIRGAMPDFGLYHEYTGPVTLGQWMKSFNIDLAKAA
jgi:hypothetical protein